MKTMSNSTSHPCLGNSTYKAMCSSEGSSPNAQISQLLDFIFLGSQEDAQDPETLTRNKSEFEIKKRSKFNLKHFKSQKSSI